MSLLAIYRNADPTAAEVIRDAAAIARRLRPLGVRFERWSAAEPLAADADQAAILAAYREPVERLKAAHGFRSADVIAVNPDHPDRNALRRKFLAEHTHSEFEVRFFVAGRGLFYLHPDADVYAVLCEQGDLLSVPAGMKHWFDTGAEPQLKAIRLFTSPQGWVADYTGEAIADGLPGMEELLAQCR